MGLLIMASEGKYVNSNAISNVIHYVTRSRKGEYRQNELVGYGGAGVGYYLTPDEIIRQMSYVQQLYNINLRKGRRLYHEFFLIKDEEFKRLGENMYTVHNIANECCRLYYEAGFQVVYAIHWEKEKRLHIHFVVNVINFRNGLKWHSSKVDLKNRQEAFNCILEKYQNMIISPISFYQVLK